MENLFSILIPSWNNLPYLKLCVESLRKNSKYSHQIIVHVNEGTDGTLSWVQEQNLDYTYSAENIGVCLSMNTMRSKVKTDYILYVNDDMYALPGWDEVMWEEVQSLPNNYWYISGTMIQPLLKSSVGVFAHYGTSPQTFEEEKLLKEYKSLYREDWKGATFPPSLIHRDIWDLVGGYGIEFSPGMCSDPDFTAKLLMIGVKHLKGLGKCLFYHFECKTTRRIIKNKGTFQFLLKWGLPYSAFRKYSLHLGELFNEVKTESHNHKQFKKDILRGRLKAIFLLIIEGFGFDANRFWKE
ncbi:MAG TPA: family 2 glycosyl transferase [Porphyromonadaceae bacterium]|nr:family 2 glycosyl transferase [Porphyromonadaceae bacterium]